ncbi:hypothetical protein Tco_1324685 [Tanacetum coccineum]
MLLAKREEAGGKLSAEEHDWLIGLDGEEENHEMEAYYIYMAKIQEALPETNDDTRPSYYIKDAEKRHMERALLASLIENMKSDIKESKRINRELKQANVFLTHELENYKQLDVDYK